MATVTAGDKGAISPRLPQLQVQCSQSHGLSAERRGMLRTSARAQAPTRHLEQAPFALLGPKTPTGATWDHRISPSFPSSL